MHTFEILMCVSIYMDILFNRRWHFFIRKNSIYNGTTILFFLSFWSFVCLFPLFNKKKITFHNNLNKYNRWAQFADIFKFKQTIELIQ